MRDRSLRCLLPLLLTGLFAGCHDGAGPNVELVLSGPPDLTAVVFQSSHESGPTPAGYVSHVITR